MRHHPAWIAFDGDTRSYDCQVLDVSASGAKLIADIDAVVASKFRLSFTPLSLAGKECEVVWRKRRTIGVRFL
jgi:hypothetical protein